MLIKSTKKIKALQYATAVSGLPSCLGLCKLYQSLVSNFVRFAALLNKEQKNEKPLVFKMDNAEQNTAFVHKVKLIASPVSGLPLLDW